MEASERHTQQDTAEYAPPASVAEKTDAKKNYAAVSLLLGCIAATLCCLPIFSTICAIMGIVFSYKAKKHLPAGHQQDGIAVAGMILSVAGLILSMIALLYWLWYAIFFFHLLDQFGRHLPPPKPAPNHKGGGMPAMLIWGMRLLGW